MRRIIPMLLSSVCCLYICYYRKLLSVCAQTVSDLSITITEENINLFLIPFTQ